MGAKYKTSVSDESIFFKRAAREDNKFHEKAYGKKIRVGRYDYRIIYCSKLKERNPDGSWEILDGLCVLMTKTIFVDVSHGPKWSLLTLLHEVAHAELHESCIPLADNFPSNLEEPIVEIWARSTVALLEHFSSLLPPVKS